MPAMLPNAGFGFTFHFHALEKEMATHSSVLAWRIPGTGEPGGLPSMGSHRVRHNWSDLAAAYINYKTPPPSSSISPFLKQPSLSVKALLGRPNAPSAPASLDCRDSLPWPQSK